MCTVCTLAQARKGKGTCIDTVLMAYMDWVLSVYHNMVAKLGHVDSKGISSVSEMAWLNSGALGYHHDSVLEETWLSYLVEHDCNDGQMGAVPDSGTLGHTTVTEGGFGHTATRVLQATNLRAGGLQPKGRHETTWPRS